MTAAGSALAALAVAALVLSLRASSTVARTLRLIAPADPRRGTRRGVSETDLRHAGVGLDADRFLVLRAASACAALLAAASASLLLPVGPAVLPVAAYAGAMLPSMLVERRAAARRREAERAAALLVERVEALVASGRPPETALVLLMHRPTGALLLDRTLRRAAEAHVLGAPIFRTLAAHARDDALVTCAALADDLERARDLGTGSLALIRERRRSLRAAERARCLEAASQVEGRLMLILVLCYLPALVLLVVVPLFIGLLAGLFA